MFFVWQASPRWSWLSPWASLRQKDTAPSPSECHFPRPRLQLIFILKSFLYRLKNLYPSSCLFFLPAAGCLWRADSSTLLSALPQLSFWYVLPVTVAVHHSFFFLLLLLSKCILSSSHLFVSFLSLKQVNMVIGILVFNKLVSKDGITDVKLKERAG